MTSILFNQLFLFFSLQSGHGEVSELSSLGTDHVFCSNLCGHASSSIGLYCPSLQLDPRRLQQAVRLLPQEPGKGSFHPGRWDEVHPREEPQRSPVSHAQPSGLSRPRKHLSCGAHHQLYLHQRLWQRLPDQPRPSQIWVLIPPETETERERRCCTDEKVLVLVTP